MGCEASADCKLYIDAGTPAAPKWELLIEKGPWMMPNEVEKPHENCAAADVDREFAELLRSDPLVFETFIAACSRGLPMLQAITAVAVVQAKARAALAAEVNRVCERMGTPCPEDPSSALLRIKSHELAGTFVAQHCDRILVADDADSASEAGPKKLAKIDGAVGRFLEGCARPVSCTIAKQDVAQLAGGQHWDARPRMDWQVLALHEGDGRVVGYAVIHPIQTGPGTFSWSCAVKWDGASEQDALKFAEKLNAAGVPPESFQRVDGHPGPAPEGDRLRLPPPKFLETTVDDEEHTEQLFREFDPRTRRWVGEPTRHAMVPAPGNLVELVPGCRWCARGDGPQWEVVPRIDALLEVRWSEPQRLADGTELWRWAHCDLQSKRAECEGRACQLNIWGQTPGHLKSEGLLKMTRTRPGTPIVADQAFPRNHCAMARRVCVAVFYWADWPHVHRRGDLMVPDVEAAFAAGDQCYAQGLRVLRIASEFDAYTAVVEHPSFPEIAPGAAIPRIVVSPGQVWIGKDYWTARPARPDVAAAPEDPAALPDSRDAAGKRGGTLTPAGMVKVSRDSVEIDRRGGVSHKPTPADPAALPDSRDEDGKSWRDKEPLL